MARLDGGLRQLFRDNLPQVHWQSVETGATGRGVPDSNGCWRGREFWVEFKQTEGFAVTLRPEQVAWLTRRARAGGRVFVAVRRRCTAGPRRARADELWLLAGSSAREAKVLGLRGLPEEAPDAVLGSWGGGPSRWSWDEVLAVLTPAVTSRRA